MATEPPAPTHSGQAWPNLKVSRAESHVAELQARVNTWLASDPITHRAAINEDRLGWTLHLVVRQAPPIEEWATIVGDVVHNLRSALDALVWTLATADGSEPNRPTQVQFPIVLNSDDWDSEAKRRLGDLSAKHVDQIKSLQPFNHPVGEQECNALALLHRLDIDDKHKAGLTARVTAAAVEHDGQVEFHSEEAAARNVPPRTIVHVPEIRADALLLEAPTYDPINTVKGNFRLSLILGLETPHGSAPLFETLQALHSATTTTIGILRSQ